MLPAIQNWKNGIAAIAVAGLLVMGSGYVVNAQTETTVTDPREAVQTAIADALGLTLEELQDQLWAGESLADLAEEAGVEIAALRDAAETAQQAQHTAQIAAAVEAGDITQEQADWMIQGIEQGYMLGGRHSGSYGMGYGMHHGGMMGGRGFGSWGFGNHHGWGGGMGMGFGYGPGMGYGECDGECDGYGPGMMYGGRGMMGRPFATPESDSE